MSKTQRRKNTKLPKHVTHNRISYDVWELKSKEELKLSIINYHSDNFRYNIYTNMNEREYYSRSKDNIEMQKLNAWKDYEEYLFTEKNRNFPFYC